MNYTYADKVNSAYPSKIFISNLIGEVGRKTVGLDLCWVYRDMNIFASNKQSLGLVLWVVDFFFFLVVFSFFSPSLLAKTKTREWQIIRFKMIINLIITVFSREIILGCIHECNSISLCAISYSWKVQLNKI